MKTEYYVTVKDPDGLFELGAELKRKSMSKFVEFGDSAMIRLEVDENLKIVGGEFVPIKDW